jgi:hypothetical protein
MATITVDTSDLEKVLDALTAARDMQVSRDTMNAAVHLSETVRFSPLTSRLDAEVERLRSILAAV